MEFTVPQWVVGVTSWFAMIAGVWSIFDRAETVADNTVKRRVSAWLQNLEIPGSGGLWPDFYEIFKRVFGEKHISFRCFGMSVLSSLILFFVFSLLLASIMTEVTFSDITADGAWILLTFFALINIIPDYISLFQTRTILRILVNANSYKKSIVLVFADVLLTAIIFVVNIAILGVITVSMDPENVTLRQMAMEYGVFVTTAIPQAVFVNEKMVSPFFLTTFATSLWLWLYIISGCFLKILFVFGHLVEFFKLVLDVENQPLRSLGFVSMIVVSMVYMAFPIVRVL